MDRNKKLVTILAAIMAGVLIASTLLGIFASVVG